MEPANLTTVMTDTNKTIAKSYAGIKLGIDAHAKWYCELAPVWWTVGVLGGLLVDGF